QPGLGAAARGLHRVGSAAELAVAELLSDGGAAALSDDLFRSAAFLEAEGTTHTLRVAFDGGESLVPLIVRAIDGSDRLDASSPYGYPRGLASGTPPGAGAVDWSRTGLVSIFGRERLGAAPWLADPSRRGRVHL